MSVLAVVPVPETEVLPHAEPPLLVRTVRGLLDSGAVDTVLLVCAARPDAILDGYALPRESTTMMCTDAALLAGGRDAASGLAERALREWRPQAEPESDVDVVLVQDPRRALTPPFVVASVVHAVRTGAVEAVPVLAVTDTIKRISPHGIVAETVDRATLRIVQGPRGFGVPVPGKDTVPHFVPGHARAMRIGTAVDLAVAESIIAEEPL